MYLAYPTGVGLLMLVAGMAGAAGAGSTTGAAGTAGAVGAAGAAGAKSLTKDSCSMQVVWSLKHVRPFLDRLRKRDTAWRISL